MHKQTRVVCSQTSLGRSEVVGRPLAALLANDGARVFSVDEHGIVEYSRRKPTKDGSKPPAWHPTHITVPCSKSLQDCLEISDAVVSGQSKVAITAIVLICFLSLTGVPSPKYKVPTNQLKDGVIAVNFSSAKNFEADIKEQASLYVPSMGKLTIAMLQRNLLRLATYQHELREKQSDGQEKA